MSHVIPLPHVLFITTYRMLHHCLKLKYYCTPHDVPTNNVLVLCISHVVLLSIVFVLASIFQCNYENLFISSPTKSYYQVQLWSKIFFLFFCAKLYKKRHFYHFTWILPKEKFPLRLRGSQGIIFSNHLINFRKTRSECRIY